MADAILGAALLAGVIIAGNLDRMPSGLEEFLAVRLTLKNVLLLAFFGLTWPAVLQALGLYSPARLREGQGEWPRLIAASVAAFLLAMVFPLTSRSGAAHPAHALLFAVLVAPAAAALRGAVRAAHRIGRANRPRRVLMVGSGPLAAQVHRELRSDLMQRFDILGFVDSEPQHALAATGVAHLGDIDQLERILMHEVVDEVFIVLPIKSRYEEMQRTIAACERIGVQARYPTQLFRTTLGRRQIEPRSDTSVLALTVAPDDFRLIVKRALDIAVSLALLVLLAPLLLAIAVAIRLTSPGPVLFAQERYGYTKRRFQMHKFRTMVVDAERLQAELESRNEAVGPVFKIQDDPRITPVGRFLRRSSLDELPQLWNVLVGEMSLVGPRPLPVRDVGRFSEPWLMRRFSVRPGVTCLWQIGGRSDLSFDRWIGLDLEYIDRWSLRLDLEILVRTIPAVVSGRGAN